MNEAQQPLSEQEIARIREALRDVYDPEIGISVVDLGMVRKIEEVDGEVQITMILTVPFCPLARVILEEARRAAQAVTERPVKVVMGTECWDPSMMSNEAHQRLGSGF
ncbi:MAG: metal-sulfur cluster assembly factor [Anaerolineae bacterium]|nr:metal-sulfur cluster assembly factor [Anaerolineae bacterium]MDW8068387.1 metal-sulfur cluster assembly factor [Anaerolineae bacterium]